MKKTKKITKWETRSRQKIKGNLTTVSALPKTRGDCPTIRPCPFVSCRYHLSLQVRKTGNLSFNHPGVPLEEIKNTCALDVAEKGASTLQSIGNMLNINRERVRQIESLALIKLKGVLKDEFFCM